MRKFLIALSLVLVLASAGMAAELYAGEEALAAAANCLLYTSDAADEL